MDRNTQLVGQSSSFLDAVERASRAAPLDRPVLVIGERGTGKELIAERLHHLSSRWDGPLIIMNCAALPETLIEAELFGHEAGAFTGATKARPGRFEEANGGTLFLDELASLSSPAQDRLLRAIEYGEVTRIGSSRPLQVDVRIVAATNEHLPRLVEQERFRADLLDRLSFEVVTLPPLRHRQSDIPVLADFFARQDGARARLGGLAGLQRRRRWRGCRPMPGRAMSASCATWSSAPSIAGRVRKGRSRTSSSIRSNSPWRPAFAQASAGKPAAPMAVPVAANEGEESAETASLAAAAAAHDPGGCADFRLAVAEYEKAILAAALDKCRWNQRAAAAALALTYDQLRHAMRRHQLQG